MIINYRQIYCKVFYKMLNGRYTDKDKRRFELLCSWLMMEDRINEG